MNKPILAAVAVLGFASPVWAQPAQTPPAATMNVTTAQQFVPTAAVANMFEIESSRLALTKSQSTSIKQFAQQMIDDHTKAGAELKAAVSAAKMTAPPTALDQKHQQMLDQLKNASGGQFDTLYVTMQLQAHQEAVALFKSYADKGDQAQIKAFAAKTLPTLEHHLSMVQNLKKS